MILELKEINELVFKLNFLLESVGENYTYGIQLLELIQKSYEDKEKDHYLEHRMKNFIDICELNFERLGDQSRKMAKVLLGILKDLNFADAGDSSVTSTLNSAIEGYMESYENLS